MNETFLETLKIFQSKAWYSLTDPSGCSCIEDLDSASSAGARAKINSTIGEFGQNGPFLFDFNFVIRSECFYGRHKAVRRILIALWLSARPHYRLVGQTVLALQIRAGLFACSVHQLLRRQSGNLISCSIYISNAFHLEN